MFAFVWQNNYIIQQTAVTAYFTSEQLLLFAFARQQQTQDVDSILV